MPMNFNTILANDNGAWASGDFVKEFIGKENENDVIVSGDFELQSDDDGSSTHKFGISFLGKSRYQKEMVGYFVGFNHGKSSLKERLPETKTILGFL